MPDGCKVLVKGSTRCGRAPVGAGSTNVIRSRCVEHLESLHPRVFARWLEAQQRANPFATDAPQPVDQPVDTSAVERVPEGASAGQSRVPEGASALPVIVEVDDPLIDMAPGTVLTPEGELVGSTEPRLFTAPLRPLTRATSLGYQVADFADQVLGEPLLPWQRWLVIHALELLEDGTPRFRFVIVLVARQNGKTNLSRTLSLWHLYMRGSKLVIGVAQDLDIARTTLAACNETIDDVPELASEKAQYCTGAGREFLQAGSGRYVIKAANRKAGRGPSADHVTMDELREQLDWAAWSALSKTITARSMAQIWGLTNAGDAKSVVLNQLRANAGVTVGDDGVCVMGAAKDDQLALFEWSAPEGCDLDDRQAWRQANPALGYTIRERDLRASLGTDPPDVFRTEVLCQKVDALDSAVDLGAWKDSGDSSGTLASLRKRLTLCIDVAPDGKHVTAVAAAELPEGGQYRIETVGAWKSIEEARREILDLVEAVNPFRLAWFPAGPVKPLRAELSKLGTRDSTRIFYHLDPETIEITGADVSEACMSLANLIESRRIIQPNDPLINMQIAGARKRPSGNGWVFIATGGSHVDSVYAAAGAVHALRTAAPERKVASFAY